MAQVVARLVRPAALFGDGDDSGFGGLPHEATTFSDVVVVEGAAAFREQGSGFPYACLGRHGQPPLSELVYGHYTVYA